MDRGAGRSKGALAELLPPPFGAHETSSTRVRIPSALRPELEFRPEEQREPKMSCRVFKSRKWREGRGGRIEERARAAKGDLVFLFISNG